MRRRPVTSVLLSSVVLAALAVANPQAAAAAATPPPPPAVTGIEATAAYVPDVSCDPTAKPGATRFADLLKATYPGTSTGIGRTCGSDGTVSEHYDGRAIDWMTTVRTPEGRDRGDTLVSWLLATDAQGNAVANARRLGVMYIIWNDQIWGAYRPSDGWRPYSNCATSPEPASDTACHRDHVHISLSWEGAMAATSYWSGKVAARDYGPCPTSTTGWAPAYSGPNPRPCPSVVPGPAPVPVPATGTVPGTVHAGGPAVFSPDGRFRLNMQTDGNLVTYDAAGKYQWASFTNVPGSYLRVQDDGNVVIYDPEANLPLWTTGVYSPGAQLRMQNDGNLVLYSGAGAPLWDSKGYTRRAAVRFAPQRAFTHLSSGQSVTSWSNGFTLTLQTGGNLVLKNANGSTRWSSGTSVPGSRLEAQSDGNVVIYGPSGAPVWHTWLYSPGDYALIQNDGNVVVYDKAGRALWDALGFTGHLAVRVG